MPADDPIAPVTSSPVDETPALPAVPTPRTAPTGGVGYIGATPPTAPPAEEALAPNVQRAQILPNAVAEPISVEVRATVHDAAVHGNDIARAIEATQRGEDPNSINQQLAGAASVAASGMASQIQPVRPPEDDDRLPAIDPLAATPPIGGGDERGRRQQHETELSGADEDGEERPVQ